MMCTEADGSIYVRKMLKYGLLTFDLFEKKKNNNNICLVSEDKRIQQLIQRNLVHDVFFPPSCIYHAISQNDKEVQR